MDTSGVGSREDGYDGTETVGTQVGGGPCVGVVVVVGALGWYGGAVEETRGRGRIESQVNQIYMKF